MSTDDTIDQYLVWKNGIGYLPGCGLKFKRDHDGDLTLFDDLETVQKRQKTMVDKILNHESSPEATLCARCFRSELKENLCKNKFCKDCADIDPGLFKLYRFLSSGTAVASAAAEAAGSGRISSTTKDRATDSGGGAPTCPAKPEPEVVEQYSLRNHFNWSTYLKTFKIEPVPTETFQPEQNFPTKKNRFVPGLKLEGIDPEHPSKFCVLTVVEVRGHRLRLHFDGYDKRFDFWRNADSKFIFPAGFCAKTGRQLEPPRTELLSRRGQKPPEFDWTRYLGKTRSRAAPESYFTVTDSRKSRATQIQGFQINAKLEAVDIANSTLICVATIRDVLEDHILIHFDGWEDNFDYWTPITSPFIHPINWCKYRGKCLTPPRNYSRKEFVWEEYLQETNSRSVADHLFRIPTKDRKLRSLVNAWKPGMRLEAVDQRNPTLVRVATVVSRTSNTVRIHYDGWPDKYDRVFDVASPDLHPINWCQKTGHELEPPPDAQRAKLCTLCPVTFCNGRGHRKWWKYQFHNREKDCPYSLKQEENEIVDRFEYDPYGDDEVSSDSNQESDEKTDVEMIMANGNAINGSSLIANNRMKKPPNLEEMISPYYLRLLKENYLEMKASINLQSLKHFIEHLECLDLRLQDMVQFDCKKMAEIVEKITGYKDIGEIFFEQKIDGISFLCLKQKDLEPMKVKLNGAIKIIMLIFVVLKNLFQDQW